MGRDRELSVLADLLNAARGGHGGAVVISGEPGVGKTRTVQAFLDRARAEGVAALGGTAYAGTSRPLAPWLDAVSASLRQIDPQALVAHLGRANAAALAEIVPAVRVALPELPPPTRLAAEESRLRAYEAFLQLLAALGDRELLLALDDLHWADSASLELLGFVGRSLGELPLGLVLTYREGEVGIADPLAQTLAELDRAAPTRRLHLESFRFEEIAVLVEALAGGPVPKSALDAIARETDGNAFLVVELVRGLQEEWGSLSELPDQLTVPEGIRHSLGQRLARLMPETRRMLATAAAFEGPFAFDELVAVTGLDATRLLACIDEALGAHMLRSTGVGERYEFAHALLRTALYDEVSPSRRARLHRRVAGALEQVHPGDEESRAAEITGQYARSASLPGAAHGIRYALAAAEQARRAHAPEEAAKFLGLGRVLAADASAPIRADLICRLAVAEAEALLPERAEATVSEALQELERAGTDPHKVADFIADVVWALKDAGAPERVLGPLVEQGLDLLGEARTLSWARLRIALYPVERRASGALRYGTWLGLDPDAVAIARTQGTEDDYARTLTWQELHPKDAGPLLERVRTWSGGSAKIHGLYIAGLGLLYRAGDLQASQTVADELLETSRKLGSVFGQTHGLYLLAETAANLGEFAAVRGYLEEAERLLARLGPEHRLRSGSSNADEYLLAYVGGDWEPVVTTYTRFATDSSFPWPWLGPYAAAFAAVGRARLGSPDEAEELLALAIEPLNELGVGHPTYPGTFFWAVQAAWELGLDEWARDLVTLARAGGVVLHHFELTRARTFALDGDLEGARTQFAEARRTLGLGGWRPLRALADYDEALALHRAGEPGAESFLEPARAQFVELGMTWWVEQAEALAGRIAAAAVHPDGLTTREVEILRLLARGARNKEIAEELVISVHTVERHLANIYVKIRARNRAEATAYALSADL